MILDTGKQICQYQSLGFDGKQVLEFIERAEKENLSEGRYELDGDRLYAMIQVYETKDKEECLYESHKVYGDIQYMLEGEEFIYGADTEQLEIKEDRTPESDIIFYKRKPEGTEASLRVREGSFALFLPQDAHMPCCKCGEKQMVKKIVFKFQCKE